MVDVSKFEVIVYGANCLQKLNTLDSSSSSSTSEDSSHDYDFFSSDDDDNDDHDIIKTKKQKAERRKSNAKIIRDEFQAGPSNKLHHQNLMRISRSGNFNIYVYLFIYICIFNLSNYEISFVFLCQIIFMFIFFYHTMKYLVCPNIVCSSFAQMVFSIFTHIKKILIKLLNLL